jgi:hypothetical protein
MGLGLRRHVARAGSRATRFRDRTLLPRRDQEHRQNQATSTSNHQDHADYPDVNAGNLGVYRELQDRTHCQKENAETDSHDGSFRQAENPAVLHVSESEGAMKRLFRQELECFIRQITKTSQHSHHVGTAANPTKLRHFSFKISMKNGESLLIDGQFLTGGRGKVNFKNISKSH